MGRKAKVGRTFGNAKAVEFAVDPDIERNTTLSISFPAISRVVVGHNLETGRGA